MLGRPRATYLTLLVYLYQMACLRPLFVESHLCIMIMARPPARTAGGGISDEKLKSTKSGLRSAIHTEASWGGRGGGGGEVQGP